MARPRKNNAEYFSHDANMRSDRKIIALRAKYGLEGYAIRNMILETLAGAENFEIPYNSMEVELIGCLHGVHAGWGAIHYQRKRPTPLMTSIEIIMLQQYHQEHFRFL